MQATVTCNIPQPCALYKNSNGIGLSATSAKSEGLFGSTTFAATSTSNRTYGVEGVDASTNNNAYNAGLYGSSPHGYGLYASAPSGTAVYATSTSGVGVRAASSYGVAVNAASNSNIALNAVSSSNVAVLATTSATIGGRYAAIMGVDAATNDGINVGVLGETTNGAYGVEGTSSNMSIGGVHGNATTGVGVYGSSSTGAALEGISGTGDGLDVTTGGGIGVHATNSNGNGSDIMGSYIGLLGRSDSFPLVLTNKSGADAFYVTGAGDIYVHGSYHTFVHTRGGGEATAFTTRSTTSNVEDSGSAELAAGTASVRFDPIFAAAIDPRAAYQVFLTPGGDTRGLYVASKTPAGFVVRETQGGHGTLAFDYRIVAVAPGHVGERMALVSPTSALEPRAMPLLKAPMLKTKFGASK